MEKQNLTPQKDACTNQNKCTTTQNKLKPGLLPCTTSGLETDRAYSYFGAS